jgi:hypothetical protein
VCFPYSAVAPGDRRSGDGPRIPAIERQVYVTVMIGISLIVYIRMRDTRQHSLIRED